ncbi:hypothetical protein JIX56_10015 [Streptomyces sp. CA-210063]|uniref:hypothetical protein n=1 Tax=Streptomyces sp. CA-210063 TaxID=2801029 RepID=UPI00214AF143|nr:hypothetical protein [Streptomyces sp. CA-210063]UUU30199.1 hypothetical protein JIX56_10015 [Streptomyces sp. CA-210063]
MVLGVSALSHALAVGWVTYDHTRAPLPQPGDHTWWHGSGPARPEALHVGPFMALTTAALYLLLPMSALAAQIIRRRADRLLPRGGTMAAPLAFAAVSAAAAAAVCLPAAALASSFSPVDGPSVWSAGAADVLTVLRLCAAVGLLLGVTLGVPWTVGRPDTPFLRR